MFCVLELDNSSHAKPERSKRGRILNNVCEGSGVKLHRMILNYQDKKVEFV